MNKNLQMSLSPHSFVNIQKGDPMEVRTSQYDKTILHSQTINIMWKLSLGKIMTESFKYIQ